MRLLRRSGSLRSWLLALAAAGGVAALIIAATGGWWSWQDQRERIGASLVAASRAIQESVERELDRAVALARGLAVSGSLADGDLKSFEEQARRAIAPYSYNLILKSPQSEYRLIDTEVSPGAEPPRLAVDPIKPRLIQDKVYIAPFRQSPVSGQWVTGIEVPIPGGDGQLRYVIVMLVPSAAFQQIINEQNLPASWTPVILDDDWTVVARDVNRETFLGQKGGAREFQDAPDGIHDVRLLDGDRALSAHSHSKRYGWTVAVAMPQSAILREALAPITAAAIIGFAVTALAIGGVLAFAGRIVRDIRALAQATRALATGERVELPRSSVDELALVGDGIKEAAAEIAQSRQHLEHRIAAATTELLQETEERRKAEAALAQAQRLEAIGQLTGGVAHDFNNLLTVIYGEAELIAAAAKGNERIERMATVALHAAERGAQLTSQLLAFAGRQRLRPVTLAIDGLLQVVAELVRRTIGESITVESSLERQLWPLHLDPAQFESAILNLAINARDAMPSGGRLVIKAVNVTTTENERRGLDLAQGDYVAISVTDTGSGMTEETQRRAFEPFYTTKEVGKGTGLGLSQVYGFAQQSGGTALIESAPGEGTTVVLYLPRASGAVEHNPSALRKRRRPRADRRNVLLVEDQAEVRDVVAAMLAELGHRVLTAADGDAAGKVLQGGEDIELLVTDIVMPNGVSGIDLAHHALRLRANLKILVVSGHMHSANAGRIEIPGLLFLEKPFRREQLAQAIAALFAEESEAPLAKPRPARKYRLDFMDHEGELVGRDEFTAERDRQATDVASALGDACSDVCANWTLSQGDRRLLHSLARRPLESVEEINAGAQQIVLDRELALHESKMRIAESRRLLAQAERLSRTLTMPLHRATKA